MRAFGRAFHFQPILTIAAAIGFAILMALGVWQLQRLEWKEELIARVEARIDDPSRPLADVLADKKRDPEYTPVVVEGRWREDTEIRVFGAIEGAPGAFVFTALERENDAPIYVNRGFVPQRALANGDYRPAQAGALRVEGLLRRAERPTPPASWFKPKAASGEGLWLLRDPRLFAGDHFDSVTDDPVTDFYVDAFEGPTSDPPYGGTTRIDFRNRHFEYALTWFGLGLTLIAVWAATSFRRESDPRA